MGRRALKMEKIEDKQRRTVTFCKRSKGLFKKAKSLCDDFPGIQIAVITFSPLAGNPYTWASSTTADSSSSSSSSCVDSMIDRYLHLHQNTNSTTATTTTTPRVTEPPIGDKKKKRKRSEDLGSLGFSEQQVEQGGDDDLDHHQHKKIREDMGFSGLSCFHANDEHPHNFQDEITTAAAATKFIEQDEEELAAGGPGSWCCDFTEEDFLFLESTMDHNSYQDEITAAAATKFIEQVQEEEVALRGGSVSACCCDFTEEGELFLEATMDNPNYQDEISATAKKFIEQVEEEEAAWQRGSGSSSCDFTEEELLFLEATMKELEQLKHTGGAPISC